MKKLIPFAVIAMMGCGQPPQVQLEPEEMKDTAKVAAAVEPEPEEEKIDWPKIDGPQLSDDTWYVYAPNGLGLYELNDAGEFDSIGHMPLGSSITAWYDEEEPWLEQDLFRNGFRGGLRPILHEGDTLYMFSGYLSRFPISEEDVDSPSGYLERFLYPIRPDSTWCTNCEDPSMEGESTWHFKQTWYEHNITHIEGLGWEWWESPITFEGFEIQEVYLMCLNIDPDRLRNKPFPYYDSSYEETWKDIPEGRWGEYIVGNYEGAVLIQRAEEYGGWEVSLTPDDNLTTVVHSGGM